MQDTSHNMPAPGSEECKGRPRALRAERDIVALGITIAALILFVGTGGSVIPGIVRSWLGAMPAPDTILSIALILNIALLIFGWRRYTDLQREVRERALAEQRARELAETDPLTGCLNRRSGLPAIDRLCERARSMGEAVAVLMIDLDNFKQINDMNGHAAGDHVLATIAGRVLAQLPADGVLLRLGGDEFACAIAFDPRTPEKVDHFALTLITLASAPVLYQGLPIETTVSIGIAASGAATSPPQAQKPDHTPQRESPPPSSAQQRPGTAQRSDLLVQQADTAMYHAKRYGRNRSFWFEPQMEESRRLRHELEAGIRRGIPAGEFVPYYEQQIDLESGELVGFEMLARWHEPRLGVISPEIFIPIAEEIDLIAPLSESLIRQALHDARSWDPRLTLAINISPVQLRDPWFAQKLLQLLAEAGFPPSRLEIEITETALHENVGAVRAILISLKNQGIRISLDDFGTGYSSIAQLRNLPFDRLKIDRSFITEMARDENGLELVEAIVSLGKGLALRVTAEGVENSDVLQVLQRMGELKGQGYLYGRPEDADATRQRLQAMALLCAPARHAEQASHGQAGAGHAPRGERKAG